MDSRSVLVTGGSRGVGTAGLIGPVRVRACGTAATGG